jgi:site-specific recombinase XerD
MQGQSPEVIVSQIDHNNIQEYLNYLEHTLRRSRRTVNKTIAALKAYFRFLSDTGYSNENPLAKIKANKITLSSQGKIYDKWLSRNEQHSLIKSIVSQKSDFKLCRDLAIVDLMLFCGLKVSEVENLKIDDVAVHENIKIDIRNSSGNNAIVQLAAKDGESLLWWLKFRSRSEKAVHANSPYVFVSERAARFSARGIQLMLTKYAKMADIINLDCNRLRHTYCKNLADAGVDAKTLAKLARYKNANYVHIYYDEKLEEVASKSPYNI